MNRSCEHLKKTTEADFAPLKAPIFCEECVKEGTQWVSLRQCLTCGHVGCCDSSPGKHATKHFHGTQHPVMRSAERGERWAWCYVHEVTVELAPTHATAEKEF
jgi:monovalent cation/hydrogen antiporter